MPLAFKHLQKESCIFDVGLLIGWGTPEEFHEFEKIDFFHKFKNLKKLNIPEVEIKLWEKYFNEISKKET